MKSNILPTYFISHGGGPWPWMKHQVRGAYDRLETSLKDIPRQLSVTPKAVLVISGHWEEESLTVMSNQNPGMIYDYSGFPEHTYHIQYAASGSPQIAERITRLIKSCGLTVCQDTQRGFDHGTYTPMAVIYPHADVPVLQLSLKRSYDPMEHIAAGRALSPLREEGVLIVGSGLSYHNLGKFGPMAKQPSATFDTWLQATLNDEDCSERINRLINWEAAPAAREAHPREDHLLPLMVAVGAAEKDKARCIYHEESFLGGVVVSSFIFGG